jgi:hypothetical protein
MTVFAKPATLDPLWGYLLISGFFPGFSLALAFATRPSASLLVLLRTWSSWPIPFEPDRRHTP